MKLTLKNFFINKSLQDKYIIDLGGGDGTDADFFASKGADVICIDKKQPVKQNAKVTFISADYFNEISKVTPYFSKREIDVLCSSYSICFNSRENIEKQMPLFFSKVSKGGILFILDFNDQEKTVIKRTNIFEDWFFALVREYFDQVEIVTESVFEKEHNHNHEIFQISGIRK